ncbi:transporter substrate-binding domain-containing diguanylate cyclase [Vibrio sinaloensis]|uniref:transporter substrate-binding domain-containing diguanylate cyclase n=1 Tax=Photobacterium sp. (strain ATCC 43367) TaxID=379097 RepID=UPI00205DC791|nr:sensor domain-containing diguanylate cyclase [Vibrio sinaloensis]UPQ90047.1 sensor domain-containing diguanylate cyclase [Vibrio sinaloensis]
MFRLLLIMVCLLAFSVQSHETGTLTVANSKAWKPFSFINSQGEPDGILIDYWKAYGKKHHIKVEFLLTDWQASLDAVKEGKADIHAGLLWSEQRDTYLDYGPAFMNIDTQLYISQDLIGTNLDRFLLGEHDYQVGVVAGGYEESFTRLHFPNLSLVSFPNNQSMIEAAYDGELEAFVADLQVANFYLISERDDIQRFVGVRHLYSGELRPAVAEGNKQLQQDIIQGMEALGLEEKQQILNRWMYVNTVYPVYLVPLSALAIAIVVVGYIVMLNLTVKARTRELQRANQELKTLSETDQLTGLSNRRHFVEQLERRLKSKGSIAVMIFDIDDFKSINDTHGHQAGDRVIRDVARAAKSVLSEPHLIGRIGGEEFAVIVNNENYHDVAELAEMICAQVRTVGLREDHTREVTVSLGCAYYSNVETSISLSDADKLMYQSKLAGKDCVTAKQIL